MFVVKAEEAERMENPHGVDVRALLKKENVKVMLVTLKPGEALERHTTPFDAFIYIIKGKAVVEVGEENEKVKKDTLVFLPKDIPHAVKNEGNLTLKFLVVKLG
ncbi:MULTISPECIES: cupin domain-containing protein [Thermococcus]|uniref:Putative carbohydrate-binding protein n=1 Tax=Thermococcus sibiricus (strain DSM 12597 / MM 739) TaxID=604354 RepID=C6A594_THESM|nr:MULTISPECIES: cupin domain-containing protein [Thermococcus]ACS90789.1 Putative carbohydrate-binding protein [Thermococcus sibiricus MM 739]MBC7094190.1 cupin domain-containing protein [Thermococcus sp.]